MIVCLKIAIAYGGYSRSHGIPGVYVGPKMVVIICELKCLLITSALHNSD